MFCVEYLNVMCLWFSDSKIVQTQHLSQQFNLKAAQLNKSNSDQNGSYLLNTSLVSNTLAFTFKKIYVLFFHI